MAKPASPKKSTKPSVAIIMGSQSDWPTMKHAAETLDVLKIGYEALIRWQHPELGLLLPDAFIPAVEQAGSIAHLTRWVLREAVARCAAWRNQGVSLSVAVNMSVDDLTDEYLPYYLLEVTQKHQLAPHTLTLEVTESAIMHNVQKSLAVVNCIHELGFRLAIDDFGTGHSALAQLRLCGSGEAVPPLRRSLLRSQARCYWR